MMLEAKRAQQCKSAICTTTTGPSQDRPATCDEAGRGQREGDLLAGALLQEQPTRGIEEHNLSPEKLQRNGAAETANSSDVCLRMICDTILRHETIST